MDCVQTKGWGCDTDRVPRAVAEVEARIEAEPRPALEEHLLGGPALAGRWRRRWGGAEGRRRGPEAKGGTGGGGDAHRGNG